MTKLDKAHAFRRLIWPIVGLGILALVAIGGTIAQLRSDELENAAREQTDLATLFGQQISNANRAIDTVLNEIVSGIREAHPRDAAQFREALGSPSTARRLADFVGSAARVELAEIVAADGDFVNSSSERASSPRNFAHADDFVYLSEHDTAATYIGRPQQGDVSGKTRIFYSRRVNALDGSFLGLVRVGMNLNYFYDLYTAISALKGKSLTIARDDGVVLMRVPASISAFYSTIPVRSAWREALAAGGGVFETQGVIDPGRHLNALRLVDDFPLVVDVAQAKSAILARWRMRAGEISFGAVLALLCAAFLARAQYAHFDSLARSEASLAAKSRDLEQVNSRFATVLENLHQGVALFSQDRQLIVGNSRYGAIYELSPRDVAPGARFGDIMSRRIAKGVYGHDADPGAKLESLTDAIGAKPQVLERLANGRAVLISRRPIEGGGWLTVHEDVTERQLAEDRIQSLAFYDQLTGVANRVHLIREMSRRLAAMPGESGSLGVILVDLDDFKGVNDTHGHPFGDALLKAVAERLCETAGMRALVARLGGDEFAVLQYEADLPQKADLPNQILENMRRPFEIQGYVLHIRPSIGVARAPRDGADVETLLKNADLALYAAKEVGRDRIKAFEPSLDREIRAERQLKGELAEALAQRQFETHYQPIVDARTHEMLQVEALVRWRHPDRGMIPPSQFIKLAEQNGLIHEIGAFVLREACRKAKNLPASVGVSVNISPAQFGRGDVVRLVAAALEESGLAPARLTLEVTETALIENFEQSRAILAAIRELGVRIALDDFGSGYSSLSYLQNIVMDEIKIDRAFVAEMENNPRTRSIVALIASIARLLGATVVAEGIETESQLELVTAAGCHRAQGYYFGRPRPFEQLSVERREGSKPIAA